jgi:low affinity Fe/Cu permease
LDVVDKKGQGKNVALFTRFARDAATVTGKPVTFITATLVIIIWAIAGPMFGFSDTWQLVINTSTTIITFLMVFLIQNTQNRDTEALQIKLDEIIRSNKGARNEVLDLEEMDEAQLDQIRKEYLDLAEHARVHLEKRGNAREDEVQD